LTNTIIYIVQGWQTKAYGLGPFQRQMNRSE